MRSIKGECRAVIHAPVERVWDLFADVEQMGTLSPECHRVEWMDGHAGGEGAQFRGYNKIGAFEWWTVSDVVEWSPPASSSSEASLAWEASGHEGGEKLTRWRYTFRPDGEGATEVTSSFETLKLSIVLVDATDEQLADRKRMLEDAMHQTLMAADAVLTGGPLERSD